MNGINFDKDVEFLIVEFNGKLIKGHTYTLSMNFTGVLSDQLKGFYRSSYIEGGVEKYADNHSLNKITFYFRDGRRWITHDTIALSS